MEFFVINSLMSVTTLVSLLVNKLIYSFTYMTINRSVSNVFFLFFVRCSFTIFSNWYHMNCQKMLLLNSESAGEDFPKACGCIGCDQCLCPHHEMAEEYKKSRLVPSP